MALTFPCRSSPSTSWATNLWEPRKFDEAIAVFQRNVELYPASANVHDSLGEGYETAGKFDLATQQFQQAVEVGTKISDPNLEAYKGHLKRVTAEAKAISDKAAAPK